MWWKSNLLSHNVISWSTTFNQEIYPCPTRTMYSTFKWNCTRVQIPQLDSSSASLLLQSLLYMQSTYWRPPSYSICSMNAKPHSIHYNNHDECFLVIQTNSNLKFILQSNNTKVPAHLIHFFLFHLDLINTQKMSGNTAFFKVLNVLAIVSLVLSLIGNLITWYCK